MVSMTKRRPVLYFAAQIACKRSLPPAFVFALRAGDFQIPDKGKLPQRRTSKREKASYATAC